MIDQNEENLATARDYLEGRGVFPSAPPSTSSPAVS